MRVAGAEGKNKKISSWEAAIWDHIISSDGTHCPFRDNCTFKPATGWCIDECFEKIIKLCDSKRPNIRDFDSLRSGQCGGIFSITEILANRYHGLGGVHSAVGLLH